MNDNVLEFWIRAKDAASGVLSATLEKVKRFGSQVSESMAKVKDSLSGSGGEDFAKTAEVLDVVGMELDKVGVKGEDFAKVYDKVCDTLRQFNDGSIDTTTLLSSFVTTLQDAGMSAADAGKCLGVLERNIVKVGSEATSTGKVTSAAMEKMRGAMNALGNTFQTVKKKLGMGDVEEKYIRTTSVLDALGRAFDRLGLSQEDFARVYDTMKVKMDEFNKTGGDAKVLFDALRKALDGTGMSAKQISQGVEMMKRNLNDAGTTGKQVAKEMRSDLRGVHIAMGAVNGDAYSLARAFTFVIEKIKALGMSAAALTGITIAIYAITEAVSKCVDWWQKKQEKLKEIQDLKFERTLKDYEEAQRGVNRELDREEDKIERQLNRKKKLIEHNKKLIEQEIEMARLAALEGKTGAERDAINKDFDAQQAELKARTQIEIAQAEIAAGASRVEVLNEAEKKLAPLQEKIRKQLESVDADVRKREADAMNKAKEQKVWEHGGTAYMLGTMGAGGKYRDRTAQEVTDAYDTWRAEDEEYRRTVEKRDKLKSQLESITDDIESIANKRETAIDDIGDLNTRIEEIDKDNQISQWAAWEDDMNAYYEDLERRQEEAARQAEREMERQMKMEHRLHEQKLRDLEDEYRESARMESEAEGRLAAAQAKVSKAWGWYRDKSTMQAAIDDYNQQKEAEKQWAKDFEKLKSKRRDWRDVEFGQLSAEDEAVRQVALAKEEEKRAAEDLASIRENTACLVDILAELRGESEEA